MARVNKKITGLLLVGITLLIAALVASILSKRVREGDTVRIEYTLTLDNGTVYYSTPANDPLRVKLGQGILLASLEEVLMGMHAGESKRVTIPQEKAYGPYRPDLIQMVDREQLPDGVEPVIGQQFDAELMDGSPTVAVITDMTDQTITLDANHPLAGENLNFKIKLVSIDASGLPAESMKWIISGTLLAAGMGVIGFIFLNTRKRKRIVSSAWPRLSRRALSTNYRKR